MNKEGWEIKRLGEVCSFFNDGDWIESKDQSKSGIRLIQTGNIGNGYYTDKEERAKFISEDTYKELKCTEIFAGDCLISRLPDPIGRACVLPSFDGRAITAVDCSILRFKPQMLPYYFVYYSQCKQYATHIEKNSTGSTRKRISRSNLGNIPIPVPPLSVQEQIVKELDTLSDIIAKKQQQLAGLDTLAQATFYELFGDPVENEKGWEVSTIGREFRVSSGGTPSTKEKLYWENGNISWIGSNMCQNKILNVNDGKYITYLGLTNSSAKLYEEGTVIVALVGATIGRVGLLKFKTTTNQNIAGIDVNSNTNFKPEFIFYLLMNLYQLFMDIGNGKFKMANLTFIRNLPIVIPPLSLQNQFAERIEAIEKQKELILRSLTDVQLLFDYAMDKYFNETVKP